MRIIFAGGGTGGHLYPAVAIAEVLQKKKVDFTFLVSDRGIDARILTSLGYNYKEQKVSAFMGKGIFGKITALIKLFVAVVKTYPLIKKDDVVFLMGGFAAAPAAIIAKIKGSKLYLHEQNSVMGLVNRTFAKMSHKVFLSFPNTKNALGNTIVTGNPVRKSFKRQEAKEFTGKILVLGGSQGSRKINNIIINAVDEIINNGFTLIHQTGEGLYRETINNYGRKLKEYGNKIEVAAYIDNVASKMKDVDIIIGRSGAGTVFEVMAVGCAAIYIPLKTASENHQYYNGLFVEENGFGLLIEEDNANTHELIKKLNYIKENIEEFRNKIKNTPYLNSAEMIVREVGIE